MVISRDTDEQIVLREAGLLRGFGIFFTVFGVILLVLALPFFALMLGQEGTSFWLALMVIVPLTAIIVGFYFSLKFKEITFDRLLGQITVSTGVKPFPSKTKVLSKSEVKDVYIRCLEPNLWAAFYTNNPYARHHCWKTSVRMVGGGEVEIHTDLKESVVSHLRDRIEAFVRDRPADLS